MAKNEGKTGSKGKGKQVQVETDDRFETGAGFSDDDASSEVQGGDDSAPSDDGLAGSAWEQDDEPVKRVIEPGSLTSLSSKVDRSGVLYLPRITPGMGPGKVKHLLEKWGKVGRIYLAREEDEAERMTEGKKKGKKRRKHEAHRFKEGWVEMEDKKVARRMAELLNGRPIGGKPSSPYAQDLWSLTYLPRFKWSHLSDQMALERASRQQLLRTGLEQSRRDQTWYLDMVERARVQGKMDEKESARREKKRSRKEDGAGEGGNAAKEGKAKKQKLYRQREPLAAGVQEQDKGKGLSAVLDSLF